MSRDWMPWESEEGSEAAVARREMFLPPHLQMHGNMRLLRDAFLSVRLLGMPHPPPSFADSPWVVVQWEHTRRNQRIIAERKVKFLTERLPEGAVAQCREAANEMAHGYVQGQIRKQSDKYVSPKQHRARMSPEEYRLTIKKRKVREKKEWEM